MNPLHSRDIFNLCSLTVGYQWILNTYLLLYELVDNLKPSGFYIFVAFGTSRIYSGIQFYYNVTLNQDFVDKTALHVNIFC